MSSKVEVLCPNGHRVQVKINPNTKLLKILEEACIKKGFPASTYELCHIQSRKILDLTLTVTFAGLQNNSKLELVKSSQPRSESKVMLAVQLASGERLKGEFISSETLWCILDHFEKESSRSLIRQEVTDSDLSLQPVCIYLREEVVGEYALREMTLKDLGLLSGSGIISLVHKAIEESTLKEIKDKIDKEKIRQARIESKATDVYEPTDQDAQMDVTESLETKSKNTNINDVSDSMDTSDLNSSSSRPQSNTASDVQSQVVIPSANPTHAQMHELAQSLLPSIFPPDRPSRDVRPRQQQQLLSNAQPLPCQTSFSEFKFPEATKGQDLYCNEMSSEREITKSEPCDRDIICYSIEDIKCSAAIPTEPDADFFELTVADVQRIYTDLQQKLKDDEETHLLTQAMRKAKAEEHLNKYDYVFIRFTFPDKLVLQATFRPREPVYNLYKCIKIFLQEKTLPFYLFTSPPKNVLEDKSQTLIEARLVPMTVVYVGFDSKVENHLSDDVQAKISSQMEANKKIVNTMHQPTKRSADAESTNVSSASNRTTRPIQQSNGSKDEAKVPKWFKTGKK